MKTAIYILLSFLPCFVFGQDYPKIDTLNYGKNISHVRYFMQYDGEEMLLETYWFNDLGKHTITYSGYDGYVLFKQTKTIFNYDTYGNLSEIASIYYISPKNDSIGKLYSNEAGEYFRKYKSIEKLDNKYRSLYERVNPESVNWNSDLPVYEKMIFKRNVLGRDSVIEIYNTFGDKIYLDETVSFFYDSKNNLERKKWMDITYSDILEFQAFKPSSNELADTITNLTGSYQEKTFKYFKDSIVIQYFVNGELTGNEIQRMVDNGLLKTELTLNANGDTISYYRSVYDSNDQLKTWYRIIDTGYNGFGYATDLVCGNIKKYQYDYNKRLLQIDTYENDKHICIERFEINKK
ncbi:MAG: hypothetical protein JXR36_09900 [Bacteroidales bacterium]|nr:hypothetical protein [Bacteroidales bacterium]